MTAVSTLLSNSRAVTRKFIEENKAAFRLGLQWWGTAFRRGLCSDDYWIKRCRRTSQKCQQFDFTIDNRLSLVELEGQVSRVIQTIQTKYA